MEVNSLKRSTNWWDRRGRWRSQCIILECYADSRVRSISYHFRDTTKENRKELSGIQNGEIQQWLAADAAVASFSWYFLRRTLREFAPRR
jgi:hypothetical protein